ncbi:Rho termination factor N-terminal domain-containing protein, partial [Pseudonocardia halophobica]|uniref:Rho termination factor N-terminal domain-containing protein n=1 Tax=Pseudonocardia halophobica TaxID=29401 RepID=UPI0031CFB216
MSETDLVSTPATAEGAAPKRRGGLSGMVLADLRQLAGELNIPDIAGMRKGDLIAAIKEKQGAAPAKRTSRKASAADQLPLDGGEDTAPVKPRRTRAAKAESVEAPAAPAAETAAPAAPAEQPAEQPAEAPASAEAPAPTRRR